MLNLGIVSPIINAISKEDISEELKNEALFLGISLLYGGNKEIQLSFMQHLKEIPNNKFFFGISILIDKNFNTLKKLMEKKNLFYMEQKMDNMDDLVVLKKDLESEVIKTLNGKTEQLKNRKELIKQGLIILDVDKQLETQENSTTIQNLIISFKFLQMLCEGHNLSLQNYLRVQFSGEVNSILSINFISYSAKKFKTLIKFINIDCIQVGITILNFLIEALQGPCYENQIELSKSKIIDVLKDLMLIFYRNFDYEKRGKIIYIIRII